MSKDHRIIGTELKLFFFDEMSPGSCFFLPNGAFIYNKLVDFLRLSYKNLGYKDIIVKNVLTNLKRKNVIQLTKKTTQTKTITPKKNNIIYFKQHQMSSKHISNLDEECFFEIIYNETENIDEVYFEIDYDN